MKEKIQKIKNELSSMSERYYINEAYVRGKNPDILRRDRVKDPDNRIPIPLAKMAVEDLLGYAARPGDIDIRFDNISTPDNDLTDDYNDLIREWSELNQDEIEISELYYKMLTHGKSYELWWTVKGNPIQPEYKCIKGNQVYIEYDNSLKPKKTAAYYFRTIEEKEICDIYYPLKSERWELTDNGWSRNTAEDTEYPYSVVPVICYTGNMDEQPLFEAEKKIIDALDILLSNSANEIDRFNALIALFPGKVSKEFRDKLNELKVIDNLDQWTHWPEYLEKNLAGVSEFYNQLADRLERLFHKSIKVPDMTDESFAGNQSGIAIAYKLIGLEFKASMIEAYFYRGLRERKQFYDDIINDASMSGLDTTLYKMVIESHRNIPVDELTKVDIAMKLKGLVSDETLLRFLPQSIVYDVEKELEKMEDQRASNPLMDIDDEPEDSPEDEE